MTTSEILPLVAIGGFVVTLGSALGRFGMDYLTAKFGKGNPEEAARTAQTEACRFDHNNIHGLLAAQNASIAELLKQNGRTLDAMKDHSHVMDLRHQIIIAKMEAADKDARNDAKAILDKLAKYGD